MERPKTGYEAGLTYWTDKIKDRRRTYNLMIERGSEKLATIPVLEQLESAQLGLRQFKRRMRAGFFQ